MKLNYEDLKARFDGYTTHVRCLCTVATGLAGGQPATREGLEAFVRHQLKLTDEAEVKKAVDRIRAEEIGERPVPAEGGELEEKITYGVNVIRRTALGPYIANHMIQACFKQAASRLRVFQDCIGSKGDASEGGMVSAAGISALEPTKPHLIYLIGEDGGPAATGWESVKGRVATARGGMSIVHDSEVAPAGTRFEFSFNFLNGAKVREDDIKDVLALMMVCGLGSCRSLGFGKFRIEEAEINCVQLDAGRKERKAARAEMKKAEKAEAKEEGEAA